MAQTQVRFWIFILIATVLLLYLLSEIMLPFVAGMALAYVLDPLADRLEKMGLSRMLATVIILFVFALLFLLFIGSALPVLAKQIADFASHLPGYIERLRELFGSFNLSWLQAEWMPEFLKLESGSLEEPLTKIAGKMAEWGGQLLGSLVSGGMAVVNLLALLVVTPVVAFYLLFDWDTMIAKIDSWVPRQHVEEVRQIARDIDDVLAGFVRGQGMVCLFLGLFYGIGLTIVGVNFGLLIGLGAGVISFIPYIGSIVGLVVAFSVALVQFFPDWLPLIGVAVVFAVGQFIEGNFLQPKLVGGHVRLHPVWLMFALFAFGYLFGFVGMLLAVPLAAALGVLTRFALARYLESPLYRGPEDAAGDG